MSGKKNDKMEMGKNVVGTLNGNKLVLEIDLDNETWVSSSGKSLLVATGSQRIATPKGQLGLTLAAFYPIKGGVQKPVEIPENAKLAVKPKEDSLDDKIAKAVAAALAAQKS